MPRDSLKRILEKTIHTKGPNSPGHLPSSEFRAAIPLLFCASRHRWLCVSSPPRLPRCRCSASKSHGTWRLQRPNRGRPVAARGLEAATPPGHVSSLKIMRVGLWPLSPMVLESKMFIFVFYMLHICYVTFTSTHLTRMCICICVCASCFSGIFMYHIYTESKSKSKVWENDCAEFLQWQLPQKLQASFRQQWHLRKWLERPGVAGNFPCAQLPTMHKQHLVIFFHHFHWKSAVSKGLELKPYDLVEFKEQKKHNIKHHVFKEISPLHFSSSRPPVGSIDTATSALPTQRSAASVAHCYAARLPTSATVPRYFSLKRHRLLAQASCHPWPTHNHNGVQHANRWKSTSYKGSQQLEGLMLLLEPHLHAWREEPTPGHPPRSSPSPAREKSSFSKPFQITFQPCNADGNSNPEIWRNKNYGIRHLEDLDEINQNISRCKKNTPNKIAGKVIFPSRRSPRTPKNIILHTCKLSVVGADASGLDITNTSPLSDMEKSLFLLPLVQSLFSLHFVGKWNGVKCTTALAMPGFGQSSASSALPSSALPLGEGLSGIPSQFPTFAT